MQNPIKDRTTFPPGYNEKNVVYMKKMKLSSNIKQLRKAFGMTQHELSQRLKIQRGMISRYEKRLSVPTLENTIDICNLFKVSIDTLLYGDFDIKIIMKLKNDN